MARLGDYVIYFVDEDVIQLDPFRIELQILGFEVDIIQDADEAYSILSMAADDLQLAVIDVMLATGIERTASKFTRSTTRDFLETGLRLLDELVVANPKLFPKRAVFFSTATDPSLVKAIQKSASEYGVEYLDKNKYLSAYDFAKRIKGLI